MKKILVVLSVAFLSLTAVNSFAQAPNKKGECCKTECKSDKKCESKADCKKGECTKKGECPKKENNGNKNGQNK